VTRLLPVVLLAGCSVHIHGGHDLALGAGVALVAAGIYESERSGGITNARAVPELDPTRKVSEQDCTKPLDYSIGNIRCK
jgi:hypothetical protein